MFWERYSDLCKEQGNSSPNGVAKIIGVSNATCTKWKNGAIPTGDTLLLVANYFDCSVDYLLGRTNNPQAHKGGNSVSISDISGNSNNFIGNGVSGNVTVNNSSPHTSQESSLINIFRDLDDIKQAKILTYADSLKKDIDILYADNLVPYHYVSNKALLNEKIRYIDNTITGTTNDVVNQLTSLISYINNNTVQDSASVSVRTLIYRLVACVDILKKHKDDIKNIIYND